MRKIKGKMTYSKREALTGLLFISPWIIGFLTLFLEPLIKSLFYSFNKITITEKGFDMKFVGLENFNYAINEDALFKLSLIGSLRSIITDVPIIVIFSLFMALVLNQKFKGRTFARAVFFLPVIISSGIIIKYLRGDVFSQSMRDGSSAFLFQNFNIVKILNYLNVPPVLFTRLSIVVNQVFDLSWKSGIQILIFIAALQTIPKSFYEASTMEGCTSWEAFWKITFPMISPMILINIVYTIIDSFTDYNNPVMYVVYSKYNQLQFDLSAAYAWMYFICIFAITIIIVKYLSKKVFYMVE